ncbi:hypothetical protein VTJ49DRAFT_3269 [Mycothermus thermophilus]|uniref:Fe2OG dioxygenase domain-containing protein n=1 Tax=Humicola insolens TaxID=85995 RepID=A0ABR3V8L3_HUMIN
MSLPFPFNPSMIPAIRTRKALLILDLQNDFVSPDGPLYVEEPAGYVGRILEVAKAFRESGAGDIIWVRSEFDQNVPLMGDEEQVIVSDSPPRQRKPEPLSSRGRKLISPLHDSAAMENDDEAFLSVGTRQDKPVCARKGTKGAELAPEVKAAVANRDIVYTKTHYNAFAAGQKPQLVQLLRGRFVTDMYICGALTNVGIYATALGAGQHGYDVTLLDDCCGFRKGVRHLTAIRQLVELTGCGVVSAETLLEELKESSAQTTAASQTKSTGLSPVMSKMTLASSASSSPASAPPSSHPNPRTSKPAPPQPGRDDSDSAPPQPRCRRTASNQSTESSGAPTRPSHDTEHRDAESDRPSSHHESNESTHRQAAKPEEAQRSVQEESKDVENAGELEKDKKGPAPSSSALPSTLPRDVEAERSRGVVGNGDEQAESRRDIKEWLPAEDTAAAHTTQPNPEQSQQQVTSSANEPHPPPTMASPEPAQTQQHTPVVGEALCEGDTSVITNVLPPSLAADAFERLLDEVAWGSMTHLGGEVPRRIAVQGEVAADGSMPVYRHPADESPPLLPFSPTVRKIKEVVEQHLGHELNHVLIQHYRSGNDYISEHSDKTLDIAKRSFIANVSLGAERTMVFRTKRPPKETKQQQQQPQPKASNKEDNHSDPDDATTTTPSKEKPAAARRSIQRAPLPHNSLLRMGLATNAAWTHAIRQDKRSDRDKTPSELAYSGARISLTFRLISTFIDASQHHIWGQGATCKTREGAKTVVNGQTDEAVRLLQAFGRENNTGSEFDWEGVYGQGFDVLHMGTPKRFFAASVSGSGSGGKDAEIANLRVAMALAELGIGYAKGSLEGGEVRFEDNNDFDGAGTTPPPPPAAQAQTRRMVVIDGHANVLRYLDAVYGAGRRYDQLPPGEVARRFMRLQRALDLWEVWRGTVEEVVGADTTSTGGAVDDGQKKLLEKLLKREMEEWEGWAQEAESAAKAEAEAGVGAGGGGDGGSFYIAATSQASPADFALWPVLHDMVRTCGEGWLCGESLGRYYAAFRRRSSVAKALGMVGEVVSKEKTGES